MPKVTITVTNNVKSQGVRETIKSTKYLLLFVFKHKGGKQYAFLSFLSSIIGIVISMMLIIFPGMIINELNGDKQIDRLFLYVGILTVVPVVNIVLRRILSIQTSKISLRLQAEFAKEYDCHCAMMDLETLENPDIQVKNDRVYPTICNALIVVDQLNAVIISVLNIFAISSLIFFVNIWIIFAIFGIILINSIITQILNRKQYKLSKEISKHDHFFNGFFLVLHHMLYAKEVKIFNLKTYFSDLIMENRMEVNDLHIKSQKQRLNADILFSITNFIQQAGVYAYLIFLVIFQGLALGNMVIYMSAIGQFSGVFQKIVKGYLDLSKNSFNIQEMKQFMDIPLKQNREGTIIPAFDKNSIIEFRNVSFKYPGCSNFALKNVNLIFKGNEKICIVGQNGSGKTTFIKLLTRLYTPAEGEILLNGRNIEEYDIDEYQRLFSPVFQDYRMYYLSLKENIILDREFDLERFNSVCFQAGLSSIINKLPDGYNTQIYKYLYEDGIEPSGGESQRIAIARALYHNGEIFILDEPTAALDPLAEHEIYTQFHSMINGKAAFLITHRLSAVKLSDRIVVFNDGKVAEVGTHDELYKKGGIYTEMFDKQASFYLNHKEKNKE